MIRTISSLCLLPPTSQRAPSPTRLCTRTRNLLYYQTGKRILQQLDKLLIASFIGTAQSLPTTLMTVSTLRRILSRSLMIRLPDMTDNLGYGKEKRRQGNLDILAGKVTFR